MGDKKTKMATRCKCRKLRLFSVSGGTSINYRCNCGKTEITQQATKAQTRQYMKKNAFKMSPDIHKLPHKIAAKLYPQTLNFPAKWKYKGYDLMQQFEKLQKKYPQIEIVHVDDDYHCGSDMVFIPHEDKEQIWGYTVIYIPQCTGEDPIRFFLYPGHLAGMISSLNKLAKKVRSYGNRNLSSMWQPKSEKGQGGLDMFPRTIRMPKGGT